MIERVISLAKWSYISPSAAREPARSASVTRAAKFSSSDGLGSEVNASLASLGFASFREWRLERWSNARSDDAAFDNTEVHDLARSARKELHYLRDGLSLRDRSTHEEQPGRLM